MEELGSMEKAIMEKMHVDRKYYLSQLEALRENGLIKVLTGLRRCGKSQLLLDFAKQIKNDNNTIFVNLEAREHAYISDWTNLYDLIASKLDNNRTNYIFLDEIQEVPQFEKAINALHLLENVDIYLTGSNAHMLSGELVTYLSGRFVKISVFPLSLAEYHSSYLGLDKYKLYEAYIKNSSLPEVLDFKSFGSSGISNYLSTIYETVVKKDVILRNNIRSESKFISVTDFIMQNVGNLITPKKISDTLTSHNRPVSNHTIENYIMWLQNSFLIYNAKRFDIVGKKLLETNEKYYCVDIGLRNYLLNGPTGKNSGFELENIVFLELLRRYNKVYVGKVRALEVDFVCIDDANKLFFYQVSQTVAEKTILDRELKALNAIKYQGNKYLLTLDPFNANHEGIEQINAIDWLLLEDSLL